MRNANWRICEYQICIAWRLSRSISIVSTNNNKRKQYFYLFISILYLDYT